MKMSAFVVSKKHVASIVGWYVSQNYNSHFDHNDAVEMGNRLLKKNVESVQYRYPDCKDNIAACPGVIAELASGTVPELKLRDLIWKKPISALHCIKAIHCLDYQSCELPDWEKTEEYKFLKKVEGLAVSRLPGYDEAPWGID
jgi:hypothetical protein